MKKHLICWAVAGALSAAAPACNDPDPDESYEGTELAVMPDEVIFGPDDTQERIVKVATDASEWTVSVAEEADWVNVVSQGDSLTVTAAANLSNEDRRTVIVVATLRAWLQAPVEVMQAGIPVNVLEVDPTELMFASDGDQSLNVTVTTDALAWNAVTEADWLKLEPDGNTLAVTASPNGESAAREAVITVQAGQLSAEIRVTQSA